MAKLKIVTLGQVTATNVENAEIVEQFSINSSTPLDLIQFEESLRFVLLRQEVNAFLVELETLAQNPGLKELLEKTGNDIVTNEKSNNNNARRLSLVVKRLIDIAIALVGVVIMGLVAVIVYPIVQKQSPGSIIFAQDRVGKQGKRFKMYKFRSMYLDAEERKKDLLNQNEVNSGLMFKLENDPRIFPFGQKMRSWSIDELPQFINVLKGDMSLIGTRPPTVDEVSKYELHHFKRLAMKPGITGMWQVSGRSNIQDFEEVVKLDASYIDNWSLWLDMKIFFKTIKVVLLREGSK